MQGFPLIAAKGAWPGYDWLLAKETKGWLPEVDGLHLCVQRLGLDEVAIREIQEQARIKQLLPASAIMTDWLLCGSVCSRRRGKAEGMR
ncbi:hypothetical protein FHU13_005614 [Methylobacterium sp. R2-1]|nr:hypothetical protein [Methylobacterium sp. R2-1]